MTTIGIVGAGSHGRAVAEIVRAIGWSHQFYDDDYTLDASPVEALHEPQGWVLGIHDPRARVEVAARIPSRATRLVHPSVIRGEGITRGWGSVIAAGCVLTCDVRVGVHTHLNVGVTVSQGTWLGDFVTVSPGVHIAGECRVGDRTFLGVGASVSNLVAIGSDCVIGAGAVVLDDVPDGTVVVGVPAKPLVTA